MYLKTEGNLTAWRKQGGSRRRLRRWSVNIRAAIDMAGGVDGCTVLDLSPAGARVHLDNEHPVAVGSTVELVLEGYGKISSEVRYSDGTLLGLMFLHDDAGEVRLARYLVARRPVRRAERLKVSARAILTPLDAQTVGKVVDVSRTGASVLVDKPEAFSEDQEVLLTIAGYGEVTATVRRIAEDRIGLMFHRELDGKLPGG